MPSDAKTQICRPKCKISQKMWFVYLLCFETSKKPCFASISKKKTEKTGTPCFFLGRLPKKRQSTKSSCLHFPFSEKSSGCNIIYDLGFAGMSRVCLACVSRVSRVCLACVSRVSRVCLACVSRVSRVCLACVSRVSRVCLACVSRVSRVCLACVSRVSRVCLACVLRVSRVCLAVSLE